MIPIIIPTGYVYSCTVTGGTFKIVQCEHCGFMYVYRMTRTGAGAASDRFILDNPQAQKHASAYATLDLQRKLAEDCDAVPCLECGKYQAHMEEALRCDYLGELRYCVKILIPLAMFLGALAGACYFRIPGTAEFAYWSGGFAGLLFLLAASLLLVRRYSCARYQPNASDLDERMQMARRYGRSVEEFRGYLRDNGIDWKLPQDPGVV